MTTTHWDPRKHPRAVIDGRFGEKVQSAPDATLVPESVNTNVADIGSARTRRALRRATNLLGQPLGDDQKQAILNYLEEPSEPLWDVIHNTLLSPRVTVWQALLEHTDYSVDVGPTEAAVDEGFTQSHAESYERIVGWSSIPTASQVAEAICAATDPSGPAEPEPSWGMFDDAL